MVDPWERLACELTLLSGRDLVDAALHLGREMADARSREVAAKCSAAAKIYRETHMEAHTNGVFAHGFAAGLEEGAKLALSMEWLK